MNNSYFEILRPGINTTIQDIGRNHLYHIGITISGAVDQRKYKIANSLVNNPESINPNFNQQAGTPRQTQ